MTYEILRFVDQVFQHDHNYVRQRKLIDNATSVTNAKRPSDSGEKSWQRVETHH